jgi:signal transduction histidine kinase
MRGTWRTVALVAAVAGVGALATLLVGAAMGMGAPDLLDLLTSVLAAMIVTVVAAFAARPLLGRASLRQRFVALPLVAAGVALANVTVLSATMFVSDHDAVVLMVLLVYGIAAGVAAALMLARTTTGAMATLSATADALGRGDLDARAGTMDAGPELDALARTLDQMAERLQASQARERQVESIRRDLITTVSHDLRTPLASLRAMVEAVDDGIVTDTPSLQRYAGEMRRSVTQLSDMVDDLFELAQLDAGAIESETRRARVDDLVNRAVATVGPAADAKGLALVTDLRVGDAACSPRLARVLQNLLVNAVRHTPADGTVRIEAHRVGDRLQLAVEDTGEGIGPEDLTHVFEPFFRADPARSGAGAGLGLALAKRIVEALGGNISAESSTAAGSRFAVDLPLG